MQIRSAVEVAARTTAAWMSLGEPGHHGPWVGHRCWKGGSMTQSPCEDVQLVPLELRGDASDWVGSGASSSSRSDQVAASELSVVGPANTSAGRPATSIDPAP